MRVYLLLILFFASTVLARARVRRDANASTVNPNAITNGIGSAIVTGDACKGEECKDSNNSLSFPIISKFVKAMLVMTQYGLSTILKTLNATNKIVLYTAIMPFEIPYYLMISSLKWTLSVFKWMFIYAELALRSIFHFR